MKEQFEKKLEDEAVRNIELSLKAGAPNNPEEIHEQEEEKPEEFPPADQEQPEMKLEDKVKSSDKENKEVA